MTRDEMIRRLNANRGGKGKISDCERALAGALGLQCHVVIPTGKPSPYPRHYTIDIGDPIAKVAIEVDGPSHRTLWVKRADIRKTRFLRSLGWRVFRCTNRDVMEHFEQTHGRILRGICR
jgi:hypothetical protein